MRGQVRTWLSLENGAGQGTLLFHTLTPLPCCPGSRKELPSFLGTTHRQSSGAAAKCHPRKWSWQKLSCPLRPELGNDHMWDQRRSWPGLPDEAMGPRAWHTCPPTQGEEREPHLEWVRGERLSEGTPWQGFLSPVAVGVCGCATLTFPSDLDSASSTGLLLGRRRLGLPPECLPTGVMAYALSSELC